MPLYFFNVMDGRELCGGQILLFGFLQNVHSDSFILEFEWNRNGMGDSDIYYL